MNRHVRSVGSIRAAKAGYIVMSVALCVLGLFFIIYPDLTASVVGIICGIMLVLFGAVKMMGYFSRDLYRLAFQYDFAFGILLILLGVLILCRPGSLMSFISVVLGMSVLCDGLFKIQISADSKRFGIGRWWLILLLAVISVAAGIFLLCRPYESAAAMIILFGISLICEGLLNLSVALFTVKVIDHQLSDDREDRDL